MVDNVTGTVVLEVFFALVSMYNPRETFEKPTRALRLEIRGLQSCRIALDYLRKALAVP